MPRANESGNRMKTAVAHCCIVIIKLNFFRRKHDYQCMECFHPVTFPIWQYPNLVCVIIYISARQKNKLCHTVLPTIYFPFPNQLTSIIRNLKILDKLTSYYSNRCNLQKNHTDGEKVFFAYCIHSIIMVSETKFNVFFLTIIRTDV